MKIKALFFSLLIFSKVVMSQTGTVGSPFTSLYQARTVTTPGTYYFNLGGTTFNTHVAADGWLLVAIDFVGAPAAALPQVSSLTTATRAILTPSVLSKLNEIKRVKISTSNGTTNAVTTNTTIISRVKNNQTLNSVIADNALLGAGTWVGTGAAGLNGLLGGNSTGPLGLHAQVIHGVNNGAMLHWQPAGGYRSSPDYFTIPPSGTSFNLWVQAADMPGGINGEIWYKANADVTVATGVSLWKDQTHNAINLTQATTTKQPVINSTGALMINFNPSIAFDGTDDVINTATISQSLVIGGVNPNFTSSNFVVYRSPNTSNGILYNQSNGSGGIWNIGMNKNSGIITNRSIGSIPVTANDIKLQSLIGNANTSASINVNGNVSSTTLGSSVGTAGNSPFWVGAQGTGGFSASHIAEIIVYPSDLSTTATNKQRIESYLGLKYGISLPFNYVASDNSTVFWNTTTAASYSNNIAGIGKDNISGLEQKQSQSQNAGNQVIFGLGTVVASNAVNTNTFTADKQFMVWGDNNLTNGAMFVESADPSINYKINRVWFAQNTNSFNKAVQLLVPATLFGAASSVSKVIINKLNSSFPNDGSNIIVSPTSTTTVNSVIYYAFNLTASQVSSNFYFTLAKTCSPVVSIVSTPTAICGVGSTATISATVGKTNGLIFNGTTTSLNTPNIISTQMPANDVTVELWFKPTTAGVIMNELGNSGWQQTQIEVSTTGEVNVRVYNLAPVSLGTVAFNTWNHVALRYSTVGTKLDGVLNGVPSSGSTIGARDRSGATNYKFGLIGSNNMGTNTMFNGAMDEIRIWKVARTNAEIASNMNKVLPATSANLVAYYQFNELSGTTTADATAALNTGTIVNTAGFLIPSTAPVGNSYLWSTSATTSSIVVSPTVTTTYSLQITDAENCQGTQTFSLNVYALPTISVAANPTVICAGSPSTLTASGASTYTWTSGPSTSTNTVNTAGTYTVLGTNGNGCVNTQTVSLLANGVPTLAVNNGSICSGDSYTISPSGASSYTYSGGSDIVSPLITTTYTVVGSNTAGCVSSKTLSVEVNKKPNTVITGTNTICTGNSATLSTQFLGSAIGGVVTYSAGYAIHTFTSNGTFSVTGNLPVEYLIVAGGGGGGYRHGAGGGGGGLLTGSLSVTAASFPIIIGAGGAGGAAALPDGRNGSNSSALSYTAIGGGGGGSNDGPTPGNGGSGGGAPQGRTPGTAVSGQGFSGGAGSAANFNHGGGGGAGGVGVSGTNTQSGNGGPGLLSNISGSATYYAGGGGGGDHIPASALQALGGIGGGGKGGVPNLNNPGENGAANTGGGGGGASTTSGGNSNGGNGGSGIVIIRYLLSNTGSEPSSYAWSTGATTSSISVTPTVTTTYSVVATSTAGCVGNTSVFTVSVNALPVVTAAANPTTICGSGTSTLTAGGASTYTWTSGPSTSTNTTTSAGTFTVAGTNGNGCVNTQTVSLVINALPTLTVSNGTICVGGSYTISPSGASTYVYSGGSSVVSPTTSTNYTVTGTDANSCVNTATLSLTVNALPVVTAVANPTAICVGGTSTLTAGGASTYTWTSGPTTSTNTVSTAGTYTVTGTNGNGCVNTQTVSLVVNTLPVVTAVANPTAICAGGTSTFTAGGASTYTWTSGPTTSTNTASTAGTYTVTGTNGNGCVNTQTVSLAVNSNPTLALGTVKNVSCLGSSTGSISTVASGGASGYSYAWTSAVSTTNTATGLLAGVYTTTVTDANGCKATLTNTVAAPSTSLSASVATSTAGCGLANGTATVTATGGWNTGYTYQWQSSASTTTLGSGYVAGTYTTNVTDANGCSIVKTFTILNATTPTVNVVSSSSVICSGQTTTLTPSGAVSYTLSLPSTTFTSNVAVSPITTTVYNISGTDANNCVSGIKSITITVNATPTVALSLSSASICLGNTATVTPSGANTYTLINSGASITTNTVVSPIATTIYTVSGTSTAGCVSTPTVITVAVNSNPTLALGSIKDVSCLGSSTGSISTVASGGASGYSYAWTSAVSTTNTATGLLAGVYTTTVTDANGCKATLTNTVAAPSTSLSASVATSTAGCGLANGTATVTATGGWNTGYTYQWQSSVSTTTLGSGYAAGTYTANVTDANGCSIVKTFTISNPTTPTVNVVASSSVICSGQTTTLTPSGAVSYTLTPPSTTFTSNVAVSPMTTTVYNISGTDASNCISGLSSVTITVNTTPTVSLSSSSASICLGNTATVTPSGANTYTLINTGQGITTNTVVSPIATTIYTVSGTSTAGCVSTPTVITVAVNSNPTLALGSIKDVSCLGSSTGSISTVASGGASGYSYAWTSAVSTTNTATGLLAGVYTTTVTDANGCKATLTNTVAAPSTSLSASVATSTTGCGLSNGTATVTATGGWNTGYTYQWQLSVSTTTLASGYGAGTYNATVSDANGCSVVKTFTISNPTTPTVNVVASSSLICSGQTTTLTPSGAVSYTLVSPSTTFTSNVAVSPMTTTVYNISGSDASNCISGIKSITITVNTTPTVSLSASSASICLGNTATVTPSGANTYTLINTGQGITTNTVVSPIATTIYTVSGTSTAGCVSSPAVITVTVNSNPTLALGTVKNVSCLGSSTGSISTVASGGASGYSYAWTSAVSTTNTATGLLAGVYTTTVTDANGCKATITNTVAAPSTSLSASVATSTTGCGLSNGTATVTATGGWNPGYTYQWQSSASTTTLGSGYAAGTYTTNVTDANGCSIVRTFTISNPTTPTVNVVASSSLICSGQTTTLTPSGAVSYTLTSPSTTFTGNVAVSPMTTTVYNISGSDASNCVSGIKSITITVNTTPTVALSASSTSICLGNTATVTPSGANTYTLINTGASITTNTVVSPISTTVYTVTGTSTAGCVSSPAVITVTVNANPTITLSTSNATICNGNSSTLTALGTDTYTWTSGPNTSTFIVSPSSATVYSVVGTNTLTGCVSSTSTTTISVNPTPVLTVSATALSVCSNGTVNLNVSGATTYTWSGTGISGSNLNSSNPIFVSPSPNTYVYSVIGTNTVNCPSAVNTITINIVGSPNSSLVASSQNICEGGIATFSIIPQAGVTYNWSSPSVLSNTTGVYVVPGSIANVAGTYSVNVAAILGTGSNTCSTSSTGNLVVFPTPTISLSQNLISVCDGESVSMNVSNPLPSPANYNWSYNNTNGTFITIPQISSNESGTYTVTVTDANGCVNNSQFQILVKSCGYEIPVLLTPNDDGKNDAFVIKNIQLYPSCKVQIFNRWGNAIYSKVGYQNDWKGTFDLGNGGKLPAATYFILIEFNDGETKPYQGYIQIEY